jgi:hypothetical protein
LGNDQKPQPLIAVPGFANSSLSFDGRWLARSGRLERPPPANHGHGYSDAAELCVWKGHAFADTGNHRGPRGYDISPDGKYFVVKLDSDKSSPQQINITLNWFEELKQRVPVH